MEKIHILPQTIFKFATTEDLSQDTIQKVEKLQWIPNVYNQKSQNQELNKSEDFQDLCAWFSTCINQVKEELGYACTEMKITQCWANKSENGQEHHPHSHPNSVLSGIYYVNDSDCTTRFGLLSKWQKFNSSEPLMTSLELFTKREHEIIFDTIKPKQGVLLIFSSNLEHSVDQNMGNVRYTISFNTFPSGQIGDFGLLSGLTLDVK